MIDKRNAFTLIELLVVISIIAVIVGLAFPNFFAARSRARDAVRKSDVKNIQKGLELYKQDQKAATFPSTYPASGSYFWLNVGCGTPWPTPGGTNTNTYMPRMPCDPLSTNTAPTPYYYQQATDPTNYTVIACLENKADPDADSTCNTACNGGNPCTNQSSYTLNAP